MFFIFGCQRKPRRLATIRSICARCQERGALELFSVRMRFRLFFVPAVPLPTTYRTTCTGCGESSSVSAERADLLLASAPHLGDAPVLVADGFVAA